MKIRRAVGDTGTIITSTDLGEHFVSTNGTYNLLYIHYDETPIFLEELDTNRSEMPIFFVYRKGDLVPAINEQLDRFLQQDGCGEYLEKVSEVTTWRLLNKSNCGI